MANAEDLQNAEDILEALDDLISKHVIDAKSHVEAGWEMRGFIAYLTKTVNPDERDDESYGSDYRDGVRAARVYMAAK